MRIFLLTFLLFAILPSQAAEAFNDYVADLYLHESHQARNPERAIRYADGEKGALLRSVLESSRVKAALDSYLESAKRGERVAEVPKLLQPLAARYDAAFKQDSRAYEMEFLDSLEALIAVLATSSTMVNFSSSPSNNGKLSGAENDTLKALSSGLQALAKMSNEMTAATHRAMASDLRDKVAKGQFSAIGVKRALAIANRIAPQ